MAASAIFISVVDKKGHGGTVLLGRAAVVAAAIFRTALSCLLQKDSFPDSQDNKHSQLMLSKGTCFLLSRA